MCKCIWANKNTLVTSIFNTMASNFAAHQPDGALYEIYKAPKVFVCVREVSHNITNS